VIGVEPPRRNRLHGQIAQRRGLRRPRHHRPPARIRRGLVQIIVLTAAADDAQTGDVAPRDQLDLLNHRLVLPRQRVQDDAADRHLIVGNVLPRFAQARLHFGHHVRRVEEPRIIRLDHADRAAELSHRSPERRVIQHCPALAPLLAARLEDPHPRNVLEQPDRPGRPALIREVVPVGRVCHERSRDLGTNERPRA
jgi:hypothetical protein